MSDPNETKDISTEDVTVMETLPTGSQNAEANSKSTKGPENRKWATEYLLQNPKSSLTRAAKNPNISDSWS